MPLNGSEGATATAGTRRETGAATAGREPAPEPAATVASGSMFGPYRIDALIGRGGTGEVHQAFDTRRQRAVALKRLATASGVGDDGSGAAAVGARFRREAELAGRLAEPHVIPIHDFGEIDGRLYLDMRLVEGTDLATLLARHGPLPADQVVSLGRQVAAALDAAHHAGLVHRDVKPSNILISGPAQDFVYLTDVGIAAGVASTRPTGTDVTTGTARYTAPERHSGRDDHRADIYALCCVLFEALTGSPPFTGPDASALRWAHVNAPAPRVGETRDGVPPALEAAIARGLAKDPDDRQQRAEDLSAELHAGLATDGAAAPTRRREWRRVLAVAAGVVLVLLGVVVAVVAVATRGPGSPDAVAADTVAALAAKNTADLDRVSCHRSDGRPTAQLPPEALALLQTARATGPTTQVLGSEALTPVELTVTADGRTQTLPVEMDLAVDDDRWCVNGFTPTNR